MKAERQIIKIRLLLVGIFFTSVIFAHPINDYYKKHKNDSNMEARTIPPKMASLMVDEDYPDAIDLLKSMTFLKYLNFYGEEAVVQNYAKKAISAKGDYLSLFEEKSETRSVAVFGTKKNGFVRKIIAVVATKTQFILLIGKGKLTEKQIAGLPALSKEI